jgi:adenosine tuberculosinyltransferase
MDIETFQNLPTEQVASIVHDAGTKVVGFPINGTRRWFTIEYPEEAAKNYVESYLEIAGQKHIEIYKLFFDHGIETLLTPIIGPDILKRGEDYDSIVEFGLVWFAQNQAFLDFYEDYDIRVRVYGDTKRYLQDTPYAHVLPIYEDLNQLTGSHHSGQLFFGICGHDPTENVAEIGVRYYQEHGTLPNRQQIVEAYYGVYVDPISIFIGFERPTIFDMPLLTIGNEDLYFTINPSLYLDKYTLRAILYDHLYSRRIRENYTELSNANWKTLENFYALNRQHVLGIGRKHSSEGFWYPLPQIDLPPDLAK